MKTFKEYPSVELSGGIQYLARFDNGQGASIVKHSFSYGHEEGLWELAVIKFVSKESDIFLLDYSTPITDDVLGWLTEEMVENTLLEIQKLPAIL